MEATLNKFVSAVKDREGAAKEPKGQKKQAKEQVKEKARQEMEQAKEQKRQEKEQKRQAKKLRDDEVAKVKLSKLDAKLDNMKQKQQKMFHEQQKMSQTITDLEAEREQVMSQTRRGKRPVEDDNDAASTRKKGKFLENPFLAEKSSYNKKRFQVNNPFISVVEVRGLEKMPADKVSDGQCMSKEALSKVTNLLLEPIINTRKRYKRPHGELSGRIIHASALYGIKWLTLPSGTSSHRVVDSVLTAGGTEVASLADRSLHESDDIRHEGDPVDWQEFLKVEKYDFKGEHRDLSIPGDDNLVTALIVECDWDGSLGKLYQGAAYAITAARGNLKKNCYRPIYVENWSKSSWRYGVLRPEGTVSVRDGRVVSVSGLNATNGLASSLQEVLDNSTTSLRNDYITPSQYPDDDHVYGCLHICNNDTEMELPNTFDNRYLNADGLRFFQSLVRIFVGDDRALTLTVDEIERNYAARKAETQATLDDFTITMDAAYSRLSRQGGSKTGGSKKTVLPYSSILPSLGATGGASDAPGGTLDAAGGTSDTTEGTLDTAGGTSDTTGGTSAAEIDAAYTSVMDAAYSGQGGSKTGGSKKTGRSYWPSLGATGGAPGSTSDTTSATGSDAAGVFSATGAGRSSRGVSSEITEEEEEQCECVVVEEKSGEEEENSGEEGEEKIK